MPIGATFLVVRTDKLEVKLTRPSERMELIPKQVPKGRVAYWLQDNYKVARMGVLGVRKRTAL